MWMNESDKLALTKRVIKKIPTTAPKSTDKPQTLTGEPSPMDSNLILIARGVTVREVVDLVVDQIKLVGTL